MKKIAIQGIKGSNHHIAATRCYGEEVEIVECTSFDKAAQLLADGACDGALLALENTIAGSILPNYALIDKYKFRITGEYFLSIHHHLMVLPGQKIENISEVCSHPMALLQCKEFFKKHRHIRLIEGIDTASEAKRISENKLKNVAAIAPKYAAEIYGLEIIEDEIQTIKNNSTRFVILQNQDSVAKEKLISKASLKFQLNHKRGSLATVLNVMSDCRLNLTKIQSLPVIEKPWKYAFFVNVTFSDYTDFEKAKTIIEIMAEEFSVLGEYKNQRT